MKTKISFLASAFLVMSFSITSASAWAAVWYVDKDNSGAEDGTSWATAFNTIQEGVDAGFNASGGEVWVAGGTYTGVGGNAGGTDNVVVMKENVHLYGGFIGIGVGGNETSRDQRDWGAHVTTIDGEDARRGVYGANNATLDGFTVTRGKASGYTGGGGMCNDASSPTVTNCTFTSNLSEDNGGGMDNNGSSSPTVTNCTFTGNAAANGGGGGGMCNDGSSPTVTNCTFTGNSAQFAGGGCTMAALRLLR